MGRLTEALGKGARQSIKRYNTANTATSKDVDEVVKKLYSMLAVFDKEGRQEVLSVGAKILVDEAKRNVPDSDEPHYRYQKGSKTKRAAKGQGKIVAVYYPGNLRKSIRKLKFKRSSAVWVGPRFSKRKPYGVFGKGSRVDGYYAHWMENGSAYFGGVGYMRRAYEAKKRLVVAKIAQTSKQKLTKWQRQVLLGS